MLPRPPYAQTTRSTGNGSTFASAPCAEKVYHSPYLPYTILRIFPIPYSVSRSTASGGIWHTRLLIPQYLHPVSSFRIIIPKSSHHLVSSRIIISGKSIRPSESTNTLQTCAHCPRAFHVRCLGDLGLDNSGKGTFICSHHKVRIRAIVCIDLRML